MEKVPKYRFSVVIPCYNEEDYIRNTILSLNNQSYSEKFEIIIVDNNCTDNTIKIVKECDPSIRIITETRPGVCSARQAGTNAAFGEIVISTDADTVFSKEWLNNINKSFKKSDTIAVTGPCRYIDGPWWGNFYTYFLFGSSYIYSLLFGHPFYISATNIAFKKNIFDGYNLTSNQGGDELGLLKSIKHKGVIKFNNSNPTYTSPRRLKKGLLYNVFITFLFYYMGAYFINRIFKKSLIHSAPAFRKQYDISVGLPKFKLRYAFASVVIVIITVTSIIPFRQALLKKTYYFTNNIRIAWHHFKQGIS